MDNEGNNGQKFIPDCEISLKPFIGQRFQSLEEGINVYRVYATSCGFDIRFGPITKSSDNTIIRRYVFCNREGEKHFASAEDDGEFGDTIPKRHRLSSRCGCMARLIFKFIGRYGYAVDVFTEEHVHNLVSEEYKMFLKVNRSIDFVHQRFIMDYCKSKIGPVKSFKFFKEMVGSYDNVGCTIIDFKNYSRDLKAYVSGVDAQMLLDQLFQKRELCSAFLFYYDVDSEDRLARLFWADPTSIRNYNAFGDVVCFDATYNTNRYNMIFVLFTGRHCHGKCVTLGADMLSKEDIQSYVWLLEKFNLCTVNDPKMIMTDQDPAVKIALERVYSGIRHRFCLWHIAKKVDDKVLKRLEGNKEFKEKFSKLIWSEEYDVAGFEQMWTALMIEYQLIEESWFKIMYELHEYWIPPYFKEIPFSGVCRTTSMSESVNSFFKKYMSSGSNLVECYMQFNSAMDTQRYGMTRMNSLDESSFHNYKTPLLIERDAARIYSNNIFLKVQEQIVDACFVWYVETVTMGDDDINVYKICAGGDVKFYVRYNKVEKTINCSCTMFVRIGLPCCHMFVVFRSLSIESIPSSYVNARWTKNALKNYIHDSNRSVGCMSGDIVDKNISVSQIIAEFYKYVGCVEGDSQKMAALFCVLRDLNVDNNIDGRSLSVIPSKENLFQSYYGSSVSTKVSVLPPNPVKTKGSGSRIKSRKEKTLERSLKPLRMCSKCKKKTNHDAMNCGNIRRNGSTVE